MGERLQATTLLGKIRHTSLPPKLQAVEHHIDSIAALVGGDSGTTPNICPKLRFKHFNLEVLWVSGEPPVPSRNLSSLSRTLHLSVGICHKIGGSTN